MLSKAIIEVSAPCDLNFCSPDTNVFSSKDSSENYNNLTTCNSLRNSSSCLASMISQSLILRNNDERGNEESINNDVVSHSSRMASLFCSPKVSMGFQSKNRQIEGLRSAGASHYLNVMTEPNNSTILYKNNISEGDYGRMLSNLSFISSKSSLCDDLPSQSSDMLCCNPSFCSKLEYPSKILREDELLSKSYKENEKSRKHSKKFHHGITSHRKSLNAKSNKFGDEIYSTAFERGYRCHNTGNRRYTGEKGKKDIEITSPTVMKNDFEHSNSLYRNVVSYCQYHKLRKLTKPRKDSTDNESYSLSSGKKSCNMQEKKNSSFCYVEDKYNRRNIKNKKCGEMRTNRSKELLNDSKSSDIFHKNFGSPLTVNGMKNCKVPLKSFELGSRVNKNSDIANKKKHNIDKKKKSKIITNGFDSSSIKRISKSRNSFDKPSESLLKDVSFDRNLILLPSVIFKSRTRDLFNNQNLVSLDRRKQSYKRLCSPPCNKTKRNHGRAGHNNGLKTTNYRGNPLECSNQIKNKFLKMFRKNEILTESPLKDYSEIISTMNKNLSKNFRLNYIIETKFATIKKYCKRKIQITKKIRGNDLNFFITRNMTSMFSSDKKRTTKITIIVFYMENLNLMKRFIIKIPRGNNVKTQFFPTINDSSVSDYNCYYSSSVEVSQELNRYSVVKFSAVLRNPQDLHNSMDPYILKKIYLENDAAQKIKGISMNFDAKDNHVKQESKRIMYEQKPNIQQSIVDNNLTKQYRMNSRGFISFRKIETYGLPDSPSPNYPPPHPPCNSSPTLLLNFPNSDCINSYWILRNF